MSLIRPEDSSRRTSVQKDAVLFVTPWRGCPFVADKTQKVNSSAAPILGRHQAGCRICAHPQREDIERDFIAWRSPSKIAEDYNLRDRSTVYRHAHALNLCPKRERNVRAALERIIERVDDVSVNAAAVVQAVAIYARINERGQFLARDELIKLHDLFKKMTTEELEAYAKDGILPPRLTGALRATLQHSPGECENG